MSFEFNIPKKFNKLAKFHVSQLIKSKDAYLEMSMSEYNLFKDFVEDPKVVLDLGCGLGRMSIFLNNELQGSSTHFILADATKIHSTKPRAGWNHGEDFYNDLSLTEEFVCNHGLTDFETFDVRKKNLKTLSNIDFVMSFLAVGFHNKIEDCLEDLFRITTSDCTMVFGVRKGRYSEDSFKDYFNEVYLFKNQDMVAGKIVKEDILVLKDKKVTSFKHKGHDIKIICERGDGLFKYLTQRKNFFEIRYLKCLNDIINKDSVIVDIGAHIGNHTIYFSKILEAKKVISIEPTKSSYITLCKNIEINNLKNVETFRFAVGSSRGLAGYYINKEYNTGTNMWYLIDEKSCGDEERISMVPLTDIVEEKIDFIKIDVESCELEVLKGSLDLIKLYRPYLMIEVSKNNLKGLEKIMTEINYIYMKTYIFRVDKAKKAITVLIGEKI